MKAKLMYVCLTITLAWFGVLTGLSQSEAPAPPQTPGQNRPGQTGAGSTSQQNRSTTGQTSSQGSSANANRSLTGCISKGDAGDQFVLTSQDGSRWLIESDAVELDDHVGHTVMITANAGSRASSNQSRSDSSTSGTSRSTGAGTSAGQSTTGTSGTSGASGTSGTLSSNQTGTGDFANASNPMTVTKLTMVSSSCGSQSQQQH